MMRLCLLFAVALLTLLFADSILTPLFVLLGSKVWLLSLKLQSLMTKKNLIQALVQSMLLAAKALLRLLNKTITAWFLPLLLTRRQRYRLHHWLAALRTQLRWRSLRFWVRWRRQPLWLRLLTAVPVAFLFLAFFVGSGLMLAALFGVSFIIPWIGGLPVALVVYIRKSLARLGLYVLERLGVGPVVNRTVDMLISLAWWRTPAPMQQRFDLWWRRMQLRLRRWVIGPRRKVVRRMARYRLRRDKERDEVGTIAPPAPCEPKGDEIGGRGNLTSEKERV